MLQTGISLNGTPLKRAFGVISSGNRFAFLKREFYYFIDWLDYNCLPSH